MPSLPNVNTHDTDRFSERLEASLAVASPRDIVRAVVNACRVIEDIAEARGLNMAVVNNVTQTACEGARELAKRAIAATTLEVAP